MSCSRSQVGGLNSSSRVAAGFFAVLREEVGPPALHVAVHMLDNDGDAVG